MVNINLQSSKMHFKYRSDHNPNDEKDVTKP